MAERPGEIVVYEDPDGKARVDVRLEQETVWLTKQQMAELFGRERSVITKHIRNAFKEGELDPGATCAKFAQVRSEGGRTVHREDEHARATVRERNRRVGAESAPARTAASHSRRHGATTGANLMSTPRRYDDVLDEHLHDPVEAVGYLNACLEDGDPEVFLLALRDVARARGGVAKLAEATELNREHLYRMLSENGNPELRSLEVLLDALGFRLAVTLKEAS